MDTLGSLGIWSPCEKLLELLVFLLLDGWQMNNRLQLKHWKTLYLGATNFCKMALNMLYILHSLLPSCKLTPSAIFRELKDFYWSNRSSPTRDHTQRVNESLLHSFAEISDSCRVMDIWQCACDLFANRRLVTSDPGWKMSQKLTFFYT